jgi:Bacterial cadherin-like domain/Bacterial Ig domain
MVKEKSMFVPYKIKTGAAAVALALASTGFSAHAALERAGPVNPDPAVGNYPAWYQDTTGITFEFCAPSAEEMPDGWCLLLTGDAITPEVFPTNFFDEHFYFAAVAQMGTRQAGGKALLVLAEEAAFAAGAPVPGDQITFSRIRVVLNPVPMDGVYRFIHPYGEESISAVAGERIFFTDDIGIGCVKGNFDCSLTSRLGPFLLPSATPGGAEMAPLTATNPTPDTDPAHFGGVFAPTPYPGTGKAYIADPARIGPVTGSSLPNFIDSNNNSRNHNMFRIEGPVGSALGVDPATGANVDWIETTDFSLMGRLFSGAMPGRASVERASYTRTAGGQKKVDVLAVGRPATASRLPGQPAAPRVAATLTFFDAPCGGVPDGTGALHPPYTAPVGATETQMLSMGNQYWGQIQPAGALPTAVCVKHGNAKDADGQLAPIYTPKVVTDEVVISQANYDQVAKTLTVAATSSDLSALPALSVTYDTFTGAMAGGQIVIPNVSVPPPKVSVRSSALGSNELQVKTSLPGGALPATPVAMPDRFTFAEDSGAHVLNLRLGTATNPNQNGGGADLTCTLAPALPCLITITSQPTLGTLSIPTTTQTGEGPTVTYTTRANLNGADSFTYTLSKNGLVSAPATVSITLTPVNDAPVAVNDSATTTVNLPVNINLIANDTDPDGNADVVAASGFSAITGPAGAVTTLTRTDGTAIGVASVIGGAVRFSANIAGTYTFGYRAVDAAGLTSATPTAINGTVTVTVNPAETVAIARDQYTRSTSNLLVEGTTAPASNTSVTIWFLNAAGNVVGPAAGSTAVVAGKYKLSATVALPAGATQVRAVTAGGAVSAPAALVIK